MVEEENNVLKSSSITCLLTFQVDVERGETGTENLFHIIPRCQYQILEHHIDSDSLGEIEKKYNQEKGRDENTNVDIAGRTDFILEYINEYLEDELGKELCRASAELYFEAYFRSFRGEMRNNVIKEIVNRTEKAIRGNEKAKSAIPLMKRLKALKDKHKFSMLALAHTPKLDMTKPLTANSCQGSKMLTNFCDSLFAIGKSQKDEKLRYLKQIKSRSSEILYGTDNVCLGEIVKPDNFLRFEFTGFGNEREHLTTPTKQDNDTMLVRVAEMLAERKTRREIADALGISVGTAQNLAVEALKQKLVQNVQGVQPPSEMNGVDILKNNQELSVDE